MNDNAEPEDGNESLDRMRDLQQSTALVNFTHFQLSDMAFLNVGISISFL